MKNVKIKNKLRILVLQISLIPEFKTPSHPQSLKIKPSLFLPSISLPTRIFFRQKRHERKCCSYEQWHKLWNTHTPQSQCSSTATPVICNNRYTLLVIKDFNSLLDSDKRYCILAFYQNSDEMVNWNLIEIMQ